ncbi:MAG TPA: twin-arginine translocase subunit TatC [Candidatus Omnitrophota bacterium]|nr:twin-arginine translocase subunit TatC [Candidatus Omnitrophota bacterium]
MDGYPEESQKMDVIGHLDELRKRLIICLVVLAAASVGMFLKWETLIWLLKRPLGATASNLIFIGPTEAFLACVKVAFIAGFIACFPVILYQIWAFLAPAAPAHLRKHIAGWLLSALVLFFFGIFFSYFVFVPAALNFLLNFGKEIAAPYITLDKYLSFFAALTLMGGAVFEIPVGMALAADIGWVRAKTLRAKRHYAVVAMLVIAAVITPTQDVVNMVLFAVPMILLYEIGILIAARIERKRMRPKD